MAELMSAKRLAEIRHALAHARIGNSKVVHRSIAEELLAERDRLDSLYHTTIAVMNEYREQRDALRAKLATATKALTKIGSLIAKQKEDDAGGIYDIARTALAAIKENDDAG